MFHVKQGARRAMPGSGSSSVDRFFVANTADGVFCVVDSRDIESTIRFPNWRAADGYARAKNANPPRSLGRLGCADCAFVASTILGGLSATAILLHVSGPSGFTLIAAHIAVAIWWVVTS